MSAAQLNEIYSSVRSLCIEEIKKHGSIKLFEYSEDNDDDMYDLPQATITSKYQQVDYYALMNVEVDGETIHIDGISMEDNRDEYTFYIQDLSTTQMLYLLECIEELKFETA